MLDIHALSVSFDENSVLNKVSLTVAPGEILAVIGPNGVGKSTLVRAISGVVPIDSGQVHVDGVSIQALSPAQRARYMAVVPQAQLLPVTFSVWQTVLLGRTPYLGWLGKSSHQDLERVRWALRQTNISGLAERAINTLSGGEKQRVLLARALAQDAPVLLLDEPTTYLDLNHQASLLQLIRRLRDENDLAVLMVIHDLNLASKYADRIAIMVEGRIYDSGTPSEVLTGENLSAAFQVQVEVIPHPVYGTPLILPDGIDAEAIPLLEA